METISDNALKVDVADLQKNGNYLKIIDFNDLMKVIDNGYAPSTSEIPPATTGDVHMGDVAHRSSDEKIDEGLVAAHEEEI